MACRSAACSSARCSARSASVPRWLHQEQPAKAQKAWGQSCPAAASSSVAPGGMVGESRSFVSARSWQAGPIETGACWPVLDGVLRRAMRVQRRLLHRDPRHDVQESMAALLAPLLRLFLGRLARLWLLAEGFWRRLAAADIVGGRRLLAGSLCRRRRWGCLCLRPRPRCRLGALRRRPGRLKALAGPLLPACAQGREVHDGAGQVLRGRRLLPGWHQIASGSWRDWLQGVVVVRAVVEEVLHGRVLAHLRVGHLGHADGPLRRAAAVQHHGPLLHAGVGHDGSVAAPDAGPQLRRLLDPAGGVWLLAGLLLHEVGQLDAQRPAVVPVRVAQRMEETVPVACHGDHQHRLRLSHDRSCSRTLSPGPPQRQRP